MRLGPLSHGPGNQYALSWQTPSTGWFMVGLTKASSLQRSIDNSL